jgi:hypothetical protein
MDEDDEDDYDSNSDNSNYEMSHSKKGEDPANGKSKLPAYKIIYIYRKAKETTWRCIYRLKATPT